MPVHLQFDENLRDKLKEELSHQFSHKGQLWYYSFSDRVHVREGKVYAFLWATLHEKTCKDFRVVVPFDPFTPVQNMSETISHAIIFYEEQNYKSFSKWIKLNKYSNGIFPTVTNSDNSLTPVKCLLEGYDCDRSGMFSDTPIATV